MSMEGGWDLDFPDDEWPKESEPENYWLRNVFPDKPIEPIFVMIEEKPEIVKDFDCEYGCMPMDHGIGEPDAASIDEGIW